MPGTIAIMIVILIIGIGVDAAFGAANRAIRRRWGLAQVLRNDWLGRRAARHTDHTGVT